MDLRQPPRAGLRAEHVDAASDIAKGYYKVHDGR